MPNLQCHRPELAGNCFAMRVVPTPALLHLGCGVTLQFGVVSLPWLCPVLCCCCSLVPLLSPGPLPPLRGPSMVLSLLLPLCPSLLSVAGYWRGLDHCIPPLNAVVKHYFARKIWKCPSTMSSSLCVESRAARCALV